ncbi:unnamed protein product [Darwinula stevensoni]|uniref:HIT domain-containing protein n=1 Tax=Darwinula stevensoni TaxID=69355 RepID=A0A7R8XC67_9CRUS|nr:unnamed protein product [Darwinula stevensoni]CAG0891710.1 unnamed protein product [Darwinula stevensoni]
MSKRKATEMEEDSCKIPKSSWQGGLLRSIKNPKMKIKEDDKVTVIKDLYPKAVHHYLVIPKEPIVNLLKLTKDHLHLLEHMDAVGMEITSQFPKEEFRLGYHAVPSMSQLHLHVISQDFNSPFLKTKKHWNSFTSKFFLESQGNTKNPLPSVFYVMLCQTPDLI